MHAVGNSSVSSTSLQRPLLAVWPSRALALPVVMPLGGLLQCSRSAQSAAMLILMVQRSHGWWAKVMVVCASNDAMQGD